MADEQKNQSSDTSDETKNTDTQKETQNEHMIPKSRFDEVNNKAKSLESKVNEMQEELKKRQEQELKEKEQWKELADQREKELEEYKQKATLNEKKTLVLNEAAKMGFSDPQDAVNFIDVSQIDNDNVNELLTELTSNKPYLLKEKTPRNVGSDTPPSDNEGKKVWKWSILEKKLRDPKWYQENKDEYLAAKKDRRIDFDS